MNQIDYVHTEHSNFNILDYSEQEGYDEVNMIGISVGGLITTIMGAFDDRYTNVISVAGGYPFYLSSGVLRDHGDYEQAYNDLYSKLNYLELYVLASEGEGRRYIQVLNEFDACCFRGRKWQTYVDIIPKYVDEGEFIFVNDDTHKEHKISDNTYNLIMEEIQ